MWRHMNWLFDLYLGTQIAAASFCGGAAKEDRKERTWSCQTTWRAPGRNARQGLRDEHQALFFTGRQGGGDVRDILALSKRLSYGADCSNKSHSRYNIFLLFFPGRHIRVFTSPREECALHIRQSLYALQRLHNVRSCAAKPLERRNTQVRMLRFACLQNEIINEWVVFNSS